MAILRQPQFCETGACGIFAFALRACAGVAGAVFYVLMFFGGISAAAAGTGVKELPVGADYCAILRAFTNGADPRCPVVNSGPPRSVGHAATAPVMDPATGKAFSRAAAPISASDDAAGYFIRFAFNSIELTSEYTAHLDRLSAVFKSPAMEGVCIKLVGHTDVLGNSGYNMRLSMARARMVGVYLKNKALVDDGRLLSDGVGERAPLGGMPGAHPLNRRVEILAKAQTAGGCN